MKKRTLVCNFLLSLEQYSVYYSNEQQLLCAYFCLTTGLNNFYHTCAQIGSSCIKCVTEE